MPSLSVFWRGRRAGGSLFVVIVLGVVESRLRKCGGRFSMPAQVNRPDEAPKTLSAGRKRTGSSLKIDPAKVNLGKSAVLCRQSLALAQERLGQIDLVVREVDCERAILEGLDRDLPDRKYIRGGLNAACERISTLRSTQQTLKVAQRAPLTFVSKSALATNSAPSTPTRAPFVKIRGHYLAWKAT
jgi:hypothetical protein